MFATLNEHAPTTALAAARMSGDSAESCDRASLSETAREAPAPATLLSRVENPDPRLNTE